MFPGSDLYCTDLAQQLIMVGYDLDNLDRDVSDLSGDHVRGVQPSSYRYISSEPTKVRRQGGGWKTTTQPSSPLVAAFQTANQRVR